MPHATPLSRRRFVGAAAASAAAAAVGGGVPLVVSPAALGRVAGRAAASNRITLGFIGVGYMTRGHLDAFLKSADTQVLAVCDVDTTRREHAKGMVESAYAGSEPGWKGCAAYVDYRELLARDDIDAVVIGTPDHWHAPMVLAAAAAGKDIYCEKPLSLTLGEAKRMIDAVRANDRVFQTGSQQRTEFNQNFVRAVEYVRSGRIGRLVCVVAGVGSTKYGPSPVPCDLPEEPMEPGLDWDRWLGPAPLRPYNSVLSPRGVHSHFPAWRWYREYSGGMITDLGAHSFDIAQWALDADASGPVQVLPPRDPAGRFGARCVYASGVELIHGGPFGITFVGESGEVSVNRETIRSNPESVIKDPLRDGEVRLPRAASHHADWIDAIRSRRRPICDVEVGARSVAVCHLFNLAYQHRRALTWDPQRWEFPGDAQANSWRDYAYRREA